MMDIQTASSGILVPASAYDYAALAEIYNDTRVDYIVPMPMNAARMKEYVRAYDIALDASFIVLDDGGEPVGIGMLGIRDDRAWITRLGVLPSQRGRRLGQALMDAMREAAWERGCRSIQLEVIEGNDPARHLFISNGFVDIRDLLVVRRPPRTGQTSPLLDITSKMTPIAPDDIAEILASRTDCPSWLDESPSLLQWGQLRGYEATTADGERTWVVYHAGTLQLTHFAFGPYIKASIARTLMFAVHTEHPRSDTKIENVPANSPYWPIMQSLGYIPTFTRQEMVLHR